MQTEKEIKLKEVGRERRRGKSRLKEGEAECGEQ